ncbi:MAG: hypothetical protein ABIY51_07450 [Ferruginibacter sp.]
MHQVYILYSQLYDKFNLGESCNAENRTIEHNTGRYANASTSYTNDWQLKMEMTLQNRKDALIVERYLKSMKSKVFLIKLVSDVNFFYAFKIAVLEKFGIIIL